jgi:hypothetical protein
MSTRSTQTIPRLSAQLFAVSFANGNPIMGSDIQSIVTALEGADNATIKIATTEDILTALKFGLNWCYPSYALKSKTDPSLVIYAASQPGKCGTSSQRQIIKVNASDPTAIATFYVFIFGPKPTESYSDGVVQTSTGNGLVINNFFEPISAGFRNRYEPFATSDSCYNALSCPIPVVQETVQQTTAGTVVISPPVVVEPPVAPVTGTASFTGSDQMATVTTLEAPIVLTVNTITSPASLAEVPTTVSADLESYYMPSKQGSSSSLRFAPTSAPAPAPAPATSVPKQQPTQQIINTILRSSPEYKTISRQLATTQRETQEVRDELTKQQVVKYVQASTSCPEPAKTFYNPNANFFVNLLNEFLYDASRIARGLTVATSE